MKAKQWQLQEAKNRFSELVQRAQTEGEQTITKHGKPVVVVIGIDKLQQLRAKIKKKSLLEHLRSCPESGLVDLLGERNKETSRTIHLS